MKYTPEALVRQRKYNKTWYQKNKENVDTRTKKYQHSVRREVIAHYGNKCKCCDENELAFLSIDHIGGGGFAHRKELGMSGGSRFYAWLRRNSYPNDFRVLCHNCNQATSWARICPHELLKEEIEEK